MKRIMSLKAYKSGRVLQAAQDRNHEFITLMVYVFVLRKKTPATFLYKDESYDLRDTWVEDLEDLDDLFFGLSIND